MKASAAKYLMVRDMLARAIKEGEFDETRRLPSERDLAEQFNISRMTARRAVEELEAAELVVIRGGSGVYVRDFTQERLVSTTVHQICMAYEGALIQDFLRLSTQNIERRGWLSHIVRVQTGYERAALQALDSGEPAIVWVNSADLEGPLGPALERAHNKAVVLGNFTENSQVPCVLADDEKAVRLAMSYLQQQGHHKIACVCANPENQNEAIQVATWRECLRGNTNEEAIERQLIAVNPPPMTDATENSYNTVSGYLREEIEAGIEPTTAFITTADEIAVGTLAACRDMELPVPEKISLIHLQDNPFMKFSRPPVSCIDINLGGQIDIAFQILEAAVADRPSPYRNRVVQVEPRLVERSTVVRPLVRV